MYFTIVGGRPDMFPRKSCVQSPASTHASRFTTARMKHLRQVFAGSQYNLRPNPRPVIQPLTPAFAFVAGRVRTPPAMSHQKLLGKFLLFLLLQLLSLCLGLHNLSRHSDLLSRRPNDLLKVLRILSRVGLKYPHHNYTNN